MITLLYFYDILITGSTLASISFIKIDLHDVLKNEQFGALEAIFGA